MKRRRSLGGRAATFENPLDGAERWWPSYY